MLGRLLFALTMARIAFATGWVEHRLIFARARRQLRHAAKDELQEHRLRVIDGGAERCRHELPGKDIA